MARTCRGSCILLNYLYVVSVFKCREAILWYKTIKSKLILDSCFGLRFVLWVLTFMHLAFSFSHFLTNLFTLAGDTSGYIKLARDCALAILWKREGAPWWKVYELYSWWWTSWCHHYWWVSTGIFFNVGDNMNEYFM